MAGKKINAGKDRKVKPGEASGSAGQRQPDIEQFNQRLEATLNSTVDKIGHLKAMASGLEGFAEESRNYTIRFNPEVAKWLLYLTKVKMLREDVFNLSVQSMAVQVLDQLKAGVEKYVYVGPDQLEVFDERLGSTIVLDFPSKECAMIDSELIKDLHEAWDHAVSRLPPGTKRLSYSIRLTPEMERWLTEWAQEQSNFTGTRNVTMQEAANTLLSLAYLQFVKDHSKP